MERIDKQAILHRTHYGLGIYAHILRQCFPTDEVVLTLSGRDCGLCRNPFAEGERTLHVFIHKTDPANALSPEYACHTTTDHSIPDGDALSFAELHYNLSGDELLETLNREMNLHIGEKNLWYQNPNNGCAHGAPDTTTRLSDEASRKVTERCDRSGCCPSEASSAASAKAQRLFSLGGAAGGSFGSFSSCRGKGTSPAGNEANNIKAELGSVPVETSYHGVSQTPSLSREVGRVSFSFFHAPISNTKPSKNFSLLDAYDYITSDTAKDRTLKLRSLTDTKQARMFKAANFDYCTFSGTFTARSDKALIRHSGLLCIDFDHLPDLDSLRSRLLQDAYFDTQLLFSSPSGDGLKWIIEIDTSQCTHADYFRAVANYLAQTYGVEADKSGKDISRACFLPYDPQCFINPKFLEK